MNGVSQGHLTGIRVPDYDGVSNNMVLPLCWRLTTVFYDSR